MSRPRIQPRLTVREQLAVSAAGLVLGAALGRVACSRPGAIDRAVRRAARSPRLRFARPVLAPLYPMGLPGSFIPIAYAIAFWIQRRRRRGAATVIAAAWLGWLAHRAVKLGYVRARPGDRPRVDSYPSGHTMGVTALAVAIGHVLAREGLLPLPASAALTVGASGVMGASRVIADHHWATDVIGGWLFGGAIGGVVCALSDATTPR